ncbi:hypothetical protein ONS96_002321 [Cadophora gregata f. sp. sojae]|nr:hypothetical protein ONS96_002321 [Cadophora gregata f. sp. sojae]
MAHTIPSRRREILEEADWRQRAAPLPPGFNPDTFPNAPWTTLVLCDNAERLPCPPGPWNNGNSTISREEFCSYLFNNGYDDIYEVIDIAERQFAARFKAPLDSRSMGKLRHVPAVEAYDAPQEGPGGQGAAFDHSIFSDTHLVSSQSPTLVPAQGRRQSAPAALIQQPCETPQQPYETPQQPYETPQQRSPRKTSPGSSHLPTTRHSPGHGLPIKPPPTADQPWRANELALTDTFSQKPSATEERLEIMTPPTSDTRSSESEDNFSSDTSTSSELQYTLDDFKSYMARQMVAGIVFEGDVKVEQVGDRPGM